MIFLKKKCPKFQIQISRTKKNIEFEIKNYKNIFKKKKSMCGYFALLKYFLFLTLFFKKSYLSLSI
jgi:hypothetical protein